ncbi:MULTISPECIES: hypothetical protein [unclassified Bradyrhizobium]|uniref:hypothetical protein n=1 Tax=unclassified Bradyrhizobium TaxID=2631580 RepID=UPI00339B8ECE
MVKRINESMKYTLGGQTYDVLRGMAQDVARRTLEAAGIVDLTDNTTGTANATAYVDIPLPVLAIDATAAGGVTASSLNTSIGKIENAIRVAAAALNNVRGRVGLPLLVAVSGTIAAANTLPALDLTGSAGTGAAAADYASTVSALTNLKANINLLENSFQHVLDALGNNRQTMGLRANVSALNRTMTAAGTVTASATGTSAVAIADVTAFLAGAANALASLALRWNQVFVQGGFTALTDSTGGTVAATGLAANAVPAAAAGAATTSAPKAGFDTALAVIANAVASLTKRVNDIRTTYDLPLITDGSTGTVSTTLAAETVALTAVDGSTGTVALDVVTATARMTAVNNALSSVAASVNDLLAMVGSQDLVADALAGTASLTIASMAATGTGVGAATPVTMLNTAVQTWLTGTRNNVATLAAALNSLVGTNAVFKPLSVVAA